MIYIQDKCRKLSVYCHCCIIIKTNRSGCVFNTAASWPSAISGTIAIGTANGTTSSNGGSWTVAYKVVTSVIFPQFNSHTCSLTSSRNRWNQKCQRSIGYWPTQ